MSKKKKLEQNLPTENRLMLVVLAFKSFQTFFRIYSQRKLLPWKVISILIHDLTLSSFLHFHEIYNNYENILLFYDFFFYYFHNANNLTNLKIGLLFFLQKRNLVEIMTYF